MCYEFLNLLLSILDEKTKDTKITASSETILHGLKKYTNYSMEVLATTNGGDGVRSAPIHCQTEQDGKISRPPKTAFGQFSIIKSVLELLI